MAPSTRTYTYRPLSSPTSIRILILEPALRDSQPLKVSLHECPIFDPAYEALSYTWGARTGTVPISCEGQTILVTPNCASALVHLRNRFKPRQLWIDAICIDQGSVGEKNQQVPLMGEIYSLATRTVIWLGAGGPGDARTLSRARTVGKLVYFRTMPGYSALSDTEKAWARKLLSQEEIQRIGRICQSDWFQRIWTVQEYLLAEDAVFMVGRSECPTSQLYTYFIIGEALLTSDSRERRLFRMRSVIMEDVREVRYAIANFELDSDDASGDDNDDDAWKRQTKKKKKKIKPPTPGWLTSRVGSGDRPPGGGLYHQLSHMLLMACLSEATDARDKVYGMGAFLVQLHEDMEVPAVDYTKSVVETYEDFARCMMRSAESLWLLAHITAPSRDEGWPSWVPDLRDACGVAHPRNWCSGLVRSPELSECEPIEADAPRGRLRVKGRRMTSVSRLFAQMPRLPIEQSEETRVEHDSLRFKCLYDWERAAAKLDRARRRVTPSHDGGETPVAGVTNTDVVRRLTSFLFYLDKYKVDATRSDMEAQDRSERQKEQEEQQELLKLRNLLKDTFSSHDLGRGERRHDDLYDGSTMFRTDCGLLGLCRGDVWPGDKIYQVAGVAFPVILRRIGPRRDKEYSLVGIASIDRWSQPDTSRLWYQDITDMEMDIFTIL
ncbi:heterokaryon incompatibility protein-domain-containing protein [Microdochium bolleyi]|uniref:Heterokaryon incompatibility protein-domain-containing protein n=1 Tax=Microdochium bolleyi TaxID=196109 RepID=A0A136IPV0_9PEZI|nr:heterokaryon incompatibility protein-domain-containing protein [Microdochium bolleyi]